MSSKAGYLKTEKNLASNIGSILQQVGQKGYEIMNHMITFRTNN